MALLKDSLFMEGIGLLDPVADGLLPAEVSVRFYFLSQAFISFSHLLNQFGIHIYVRSPIREYKLQYGALNSYLAKIVIIFFVTSNPRTVFTRKYLFEHQLNMMVRFIKTH